MPQSQADICPNGPGCRLGIEHCYGTAIPRMCQLLAEGHLEYEPLIRQRSGPHVAKSHAHRTDARPPAPASAATQEILALQAKLTEAQRQEVLYCPHRFERRGDGCCSTKTYCRLGYFDAAPIRESFHCVMCRLEQRPR